MLKGETKVIDFFVTEAPGPAIIGLPSLAEFGIVTLNCEIAKELPRIKDTTDLIRQYPECFQGIGKFDGQYHITVDPAVPPVVHPPQRVPFKMKEEIKQWNQICVNSCSSSAFSPCLLAKKTSM